MAGAEQLIAEISQSLGDGVRVQRVPCVGRCECAPVAVVGQNPVEEADVHAVRYAIDAVAIEAPLPEGARRMAGYRAGGGYRLYEDCVAGRRSAEEIIAALEHANLRGLGGAGFPAGRKWRVVRDMPAPRLMAVNIDEGEPGTFKDRFYLEREPHRFLEGMLIAAWAVGIERSTSTCATNTPACARCWPRNSTRCAPPFRRRRKSNCGAAPAPTSAARNRP